MNVRSTLLLFLACAIPGCRSGSTAAPPSVSAPVKAEAAAAVSAASPIPAVHVLLDDPRLAKAKDFDRNKDWASAARAVHEARPADLSAMDACAWDYLEGRYALASGDGIVAAESFARAARDTCLLSSYAHLRAAQSLSRSGHANEAIAEARLVPEDFASRGEVDLVIAESLAQKGDRARALPLWRAWLAKNPRGSRWVDTSVRIANAQLDGVDGSAEARARDAYDLATKVVVEAPKLAGPSGAAAARSRAVLLLHATDPSVREALSESERARQAQGWLDANEPAKAFDLASSVIAVVKTGSTSCRAGITRANAAAKMRNPKVDAWPEAVAACEGDPDLVTALFQGAKAKAGKDPKLSIDWYARVERLFPAHRLADDARYRGALLVLASDDEDHEARAEQMLLTLEDAYPAGDMRGEAFFRLALDKIQKGDWEAAKLPLDRAFEIALERPSSPASARAAYFRARASGATGNVEDEKRRLAAVLRESPFVYYMLLAHARLASLDTELATRTLAEATLRDAGTVFPSHPLPVLASAGVVRAIRLLEVGEIDAAKREFSGTGAFAENADPEGVWAISTIYNRAGLPELGSAFSRGKYTDFSAHYPEGKWRVAWEAAYPRAFEPIVARACAQNSLPTSLAWGIMREESGFVADAKSFANAFGLMQLIVPTAKRVAEGTPLPFDEASLKKPEVSIALGTKLLAKLRASHVHPALAIGAYNAGSGAVDRWVGARGGEDLDVFVELVPYEETRNYIKRVLASQAAYAYLYDPAALKETLGLSFRVQR
ncbi:MAG: lytic transglycosylase domain-containing protein [Polyangiaceae bacterium]|nr:lytic transglycosylase domain-containing protein [Polyangiaceae bacterium]